MGIEWTLVNHQNKTMYELGKGPLYDVMKPAPEDAAAFLYRETFVPYFVEFCQKHWRYAFEIEQEPGENVRYWTELANTIYSFIEGADPLKDLTIISDNDDQSYQLQEQSYVLLGSRYTDMNDYNQYIRSMNKDCKNPPFDISQIDFTIPMERLRKLLIFA